LAWRCADHGHDDIAIQEQLNGKAVDWMEKVSQPYTRPLLLYHS
jgi:hypothetical protein